MKRFGNIFEEICSLENIERAHYNARKGKAHYQEVKRVNANPEKYFLKIHDMLVSKAFRTGKYKEFVKTDTGKLRLISKLPYFPDRIVHHCIVQVLEPIWYKTLIRDTYACIPGRGIHDGADRIRKALRDIPGTRYCLKMDVKQFYPSMDHDILKSVIRKRIKDPDALELLDEIIDSTEKGVPIGNYLSQHFGNLYLSGYDHWMKEDNRCRYYFRYCDDIVILGATKKWLHALKEKTRHFWSERLRLALKGNWQVFPVDSRGVDYLGYRFFHGYTLLRKSTAKQFKRKVARIKQGWQNMRPITVLSTIMSYEGWLRHANCLNLKKAVIDDEVKQIVADIVAVNETKNPLRRCVL